MRFRRRNIAVEDKYGVKLINTTAADVPKRQKANKSRLDELISASHTSIPLFRWRAREC